MRKVLLFTILLGLFMNLHASFFDDQKKYQRVRVAINEKESIVKESLKSKNLDINSLNILFIAYKNEGILELWVKDKDSAGYDFFKSYKICASSGDLGPKFKQGDRQVPEGFYYIDRFNPSSNFYLSLGINYPNSADKKRSNAKDLGGDIFIHGNCVSIGCLAMQDEFIKEIYLYALFAKNTQNKIPVYIFPFSMSGVDFKKNLLDYKDNKELISFWSNLKIGFDKFILTKKELKFSNDSKGSYIFK